METSETFAGALSVPLYFVTEASRDTRQDSWDREIDSISSWEELQSHIAKGMHRRRGG